MAPCRPLPLALALALAFALALVASRADLGPATPYARSLSRAVRQTLLGVWKRVSTHPPLTAPLAAADSVARDAIAADLGARPAATSPAPGSPATAAAAAAPIPPLPRTPSAFIGLAANTANGKYSLPVPLTAFLWRFVHGATPVVFLGIDTVVGNSTPVPGLRDRVLMRYLRAIGGKVVCLVHDKQDRMSTTLQIARLSTWALPFVGDDDQVVTADADIWPLDPVFWAPVLFPSEDKARLFIYNGIFYDLQLKAKICDFVAASYVSTARSSWESLVEKWGRFEELAPAPRACAEGPARLRFGPRLPRTMDAHALVLGRLMAAARRAYGPQRWSEGLAAGSAQNTVWGADQVLLSEMVKVSDWCPERCTINGDVRRIDVNTWRWSGDPREFTDAHLLQPFTDPAVLNQVMPVFLDMAAAAAAAGGAAGQGGAAVIPSPAPSADPAAAGVPEDTTAVDSSWMRGWAGASPFPNASAFARDFLATMALAEAGSLPADFASEQGCDDDVGSNDV